MYQKYSSSPTLRLEFGHCSRSTVGSDVRQHGLLEIK